MPYYTDEHGNQQYYADGAIQPVQQQSMSVQSMPAPGQIHRWEERSQSFTIIPMPANGAIQLAQSNTSGMSHGQPQGYQAQQSQQSTPQPSTASPIDSATAGMPAWKVMGIGALIMLLISWASDLRDQNNRLQGQQEGMEQVLPYVRQ